MYLKIQNNGLVDIEAFIKTGFSTKTNDPSKIGEFGTGANFASIWAVREGLQLRIFSGSREIKFSKTEGTFRGHKVEYLLVNGNETSFSINMGVRTWKAWMAIREFWCNALDESGATWEIVNEDQVRPEYEKTNIYLEINDEVEQVLLNWNNYFSSHRNDLLHQGDNFKLYKGGDNLIVYRKGIQCFSYDVPSIFHYDLDNIKVSDSRVVEDKYTMDNQLAHILANRIPEELIIELCTRIKGSYEFNLNWDWYNVNFGDKWKKALENCVVVEEEYKEEYKGTIERSYQSGKTVFHLPRNLSKNITINAGVEHVANSIGSHDEGGEELEMSEEDISFLATILSGLEEDGYNLASCVIVPYKPRIKSIKSTRIRDIIYININIWNNTDHTPLYKEIIRQSERIKAEELNIEVEDQLINTIFNKMLAKI